MASVPTTDVRIRISATAAQANRTLRNLNNRLRRPSANLDKLNLQFRRLDRIWALMAIGSGALIIKTFVKMASELQRTQLQIAVFTRDMDKVPDVMESLISLTERVPFTLNAMTTSFVRLKASGIEPIIDAQGNGPLKNMADAVAAFGGGEEIFKRLTIGIQQMAGKGVVSMEELRQQIGEAVPLAMRIMAEQMGISVSKLITEVSRGKIGVEEGLGALFKGFEIFEGAGELLKNTFSGQLMQARLEFEKLSKVLILDSGALDFMTASLKLFNQEVNAFGQFMKSPEGQQAIDEFWKGFENLAVQAAIASKPLLDLISIVSSIVSVVANLTSALPPEIVGGGILGLLIFGRGGIILGGIFAIFSAELVAIAAGIEGFINSLNSYVASFVGSIAGIGAAGMFGYWMFGSVGAFAAILLATQVSTTKSIGEIFQIFQNRFDGFMANVKGQADFLTDKFSNIFDIEGTLKAGKIAEAKFYKSIGIGAKEAGGSVSTLVDSFSELNDINIQPIEDKVRSLFVTIREMMEGIVAAKIEIISRFKAIQDIGGLTPQQLSDLGRLGTFLERLEIQAEGAGKQIGRFLATVAARTKQIDGIIKQVTGTIEKLGEGDSKVAGLRKELADLAGMKSRINELGQSIANAMGDKAVGGIESRIKRITTALKVFTTEGTESTSFLERALDKVNARFAGIQLSIEQLTRDLIEKTIADERQAEVLARLTALTKQLNVALKEQRERVKSLNEVRQEAVRISAEAALNRAQNQTNILAMENAFDSVGLAAARAEARIQTMVDNVHRQMANVEKAIKAGMDQETGDELIARWKDILARIESEHQVLIDRMKFAATDWGQAMNSIAQSMENRLGEAIQGVIKGTGSLKDVLLSFYDDITAALSKYLAKQALMAIFQTGAGGQGQALGNIFGGGVFDSGRSLFNLFGAAQGAEFMIGGKGGLDQNVMSINGEPVARVSQGETVTVSPEGGGGNTVIQIQALDAASVRDLFMREGSALIAAINSRSRINRGFSS